MDREDVIILNDGVEAEDVAILGDCCLTSAAAVR